MMGILSSGIVREAPPKDGLWRGGKYLGEPVEYTEWGWMQTYKPLVQIPEFEVVEMEGCTREQVLSGLSIVDGYLRYDGAIASSNGAALAHKFKLLGPMFEKHGFEYSGRHWEHPPIAAVGVQHWFMGVQTVDEAGEPFIMQGATSNIARYGSDARGYVFNGGVVYGNAQGATYPFWSFQLFPMNSRIRNLSTPMARLRITNGVTAHYIDDPRPIGIDTDIYYFQPYIQIACDRLSFTQFVINMFDFLAFGIFKVI